MPHRHLDPDKRNPSPLTPQQQYLQSRLYEQFLKILESSLILPFESPHKLRVYNILTSYYIGCRDKAVDP